MFSDKVVRLYRQFLSRLGISHLFKSA